MENMTIEKMFAFVGKDENGQEGLMAFRDPSSDTLMPMVGADMKRAISLIPVAEHIAEQHGHEYRVLCFESRSDETEEFKRVYKEQQEKIANCEHGDWQVPEGYDNVRVCGKCGKVDVQQQPEDDLDLDEELETRQDDSCPVDGQEDCESCQ